MNCLDRTPNTGIYVTFDLMLTTILGTMTPADVHL